MQPIPQTPPPQSSCPFVYMSPRAPPVSPNSPKFASLCALWSVEAGGGPSSGELRGDGCCLAEHRDTEGVTNFVYLKFYPITHWSRKEKKHQINFNNNARVIQAVFQCFLANKTSDLPALGAWTKCRTLCVTFGGATTQTEAALRRQEWGAESLLIHQQIQHKTQRRQEQRKKQEKHNRKSTWRTGMWNHKNWRNCTRTHRERGRYETD